MYTKALIFLFIFSINAYGLTTSELIVTKKSNYLLMNKNYIHLKHKLLQGDIQNFCNESELLTETLYTIYEQDILLASFLKQYDIQDFKDYSRHILENSSSDLFMFSYIKEMCDQGRAIEVLKSFERIEQNLNYLILAHNFWMDAYCPILNDCSSKLGGM